MLSSSTPKCTWDEGASECSFRDIGGDLHRIFTVAIIVAVVGTPFALASEALICNVLAADTIDPKATDVWMGRSDSARGTTDRKKQRDSARKSMRMLRKAEEVIGASAEEDYRALRREIDAHRNGLSLQEKRDFDSK